MSNEIKGDFKISSSRKQPGGEQEVYRKSLIAKEQLIQQLRDEVHTMQGQLHAAYIRIKELNTEKNK